MKKTKVKKSNHPWKKYGWLDDRSMARQIEFERKKMEGKQREQLAR